MKIKILIVILLMAVIAVGVLLGIKFMQNNNGEVGDIANETVNEIVEEVVEEPKKTRSPAWRLLVLTLFVQSSY